MAPPSDQDFELLGRRVVASLGTIPDLNHAAADVAEQERFNPDQIKRLVEYANTEAFLQQLNGTPSTSGQETPSANPTAEFAPAQLGAVIHIIIQRGGNVPGDMATPAFDDVTSSFPEMALKDTPPNNAPEGLDDADDADTDDVEAVEDDVSADPASAFEAPPKPPKTKKSPKGAPPKPESEEDVESSAKPDKKPEKREAAYRALDRVLDLVVDRRHQERFAFDTKAAALTELLRRRPHVFDAIEKVGYSVYARDPTALAILSGLRAGLRQAVLTVDETRAKQASAPVVHESIPEMSTIDELVAHARNAAKYVRAEEYLRERIH